MNTVEVRYWNKLTNKIIKEKLTNKKGLTAIAISPCMGCGDEWNRTIDTRIFSPLLYQLSYITD